MGAKYLCCLPLRLGVLVISFFQFLASGAVSGLFVYVLTQLDHEGRVVVHQPNNVTVTYQFSARQRTIAIVITAVYGFIALISLTGFIGALRKKESYVHVFSNFVKLAFVLQICVWIAFFVFYFVDKKEFRKLCVGDSTDQQLIDACDSPSKHVWVFIVSASIPLLSQAYGVYIVSSYVRKLRNEKYLHQESFGFKGPGYVPVGEESHPLTHQGPYPYADNSHSFGGQRV
ncbi:hypothetical protein B0H13DRAFT_1967550 [Mycena leptocephala]|nr:hypothetical protein B0H13DRAFT_1967550 [Mycena leptocephala]